VKWGGWLGVCVGGRLCDVVPAAALWSRSGWGLGWWMQWMDRGGQERRLAPTRLLP
jgi:hypothetical protein